MGTNEIIIEGVARLMSENEFEKLAEIAKIEDVSFMNIVKEALEDYIDYNEENYYEKYIIPFIDECEEILCQKIEETLHKDRLVNYLTRGTDNYIDLISEMLRFLKRMEITYNYGEGYYMIDYNPPSGEIDDWGEFANAEDFVEWFLEEFI